MFGRLYEMPKAQAKSRADELLEQFNLSEAGGRPVKTYSGGMRRRLDLAGSPPVGGHTCCSSTSRPPGWIRAAAWACGT